MKVLVVEDEKPTAAFLKRGLSEEGFAVDVATNALEARTAVSGYDYDAIVLDVMIPGDSGFVLCREWRAAGISTPILFLTARDDVADRIRGLEGGGDDYLMKPFAFAELLARIRVLLRRSQQVHPSGEIRFGDLVVDVGRRDVTRAGESIPLSTREYQLLEYFVLHPGRLVTRTSLWEHVWESHSVPDSNVVDVYVRYLRNKLGRSPDLIRTVRGGGYIFEPPQGDLPVPSAESGARSGRPT